MRTSLLLLPLLLPPVALLAQDDAPKVEVIDYDDEGYKYPVTRDAEGTPKDAKATSTALAGIGLRTKTIFSVWVYTFGLYVDPVAAKEKLAAWKGKDAEALAGDEKLYAALLKDDMVKTIRLVFCRDVDGEDIEEAFEDSLRPRIDSKKGKEGWDDGSKALDTFRTYFGNLDELEEYGTVAMTWRPGGELHCSINGKAQKVLTSKSLCWAIFDVYLGEDPIEDDGKEALVERLPALLK